VGTTLYGGIQWKCGGLAGTNYNDKRRPEKIFFVTTSQRLFKSRACRCVAFSIKLKTKPVTENKNAAFFAAVPPQYFWSCLGSSLSERRKKKRPD
jgi:hypothetical protein